MLLLPRSQSADLGRWTFRRFRKSIALDNIRKGFRRSENQGKIKILCSQLDFSRSLKVIFEKYLAQKGKKNFHDTLSVLN